MAQMDKASFEALQRATIDHARKNGVAVDQPSLHDHTMLSKTQGDSIMATMWGHKERVFAQPPNRRVIDPFARFNGPTRDEMMKAMRDLVNSPAWKQGQ